MAALTDRYLVVAVLAWWQLHAPGLELNGLFHCGKRGDVSSWAGCCLMASTTMCLTMGIGQLRRGQLVAHTQAQSRCMIGAQYECPLQTPGTHKPQQNLQSVSQGGLAATHL